MTSGAGSELGISYSTIYIFTWVVYGAVCQMLNVFGVVTNIINMVVFVKQGFHESVNISLAALAVSDLGSLISMIWTCLCLTPPVLVADLPFDIMEVGYLTSAITHLAFTRISSCITAMITLERCLCITFPLKIKVLFTPRRTAMITVCIFVVFFWSASPAWAVNRLGIKFSPSRNRTLVGLISTSNREIVEMISFAVNNFFIPLGAFVIIIVCTAILSYQLRNRAKWRQELVSSTQGDKVSNSNLKAAKMVVMISSLFIVCFVPVAVVLLAFALMPELSLQGKYFYITVMITGFGYIMENLNSSMNIFIYFHMSSKYRDNLRKLFFKELVYAVK